MDSTTANLWGFKLKGPLKNIFSERSGLLGCARNLGSMLRINGLFHLLVHGIYWRVI